MTLYYDRNKKNRFSNNQLQERGLLNPEIDLTDIGIIPLVANPDIDTDIYIAIDSGGVEIKEDGKAYVVYKKKNKSSREEEGFFIKDVLRKKVNNKRDSIFTAGLKIEVDGTTHKLQTRGTDDLINWSNLFIDAQDSSADTIFTVRTALNDNLELKACDVVSMLKAGRSYRFGVSRASWELKDSINNAGSDDEAIGLYESGINIVWPENKAYVIS